jgi:hypothetical protein
MFSAISFFDLRAKVSQKILSSPQQPTEEHRKYQTKQGT